MKDEVTQDIEHINELEELLEEEKRYLKSANYHYKSLNSMLEDEVYKEAFIASGADVAFIIKMFKEIIKNSEEQIKYLEEKISYYIATPTLST